MDRPVQAQDEVRKVAGAGLFDPGRNCCTVARANRVALLVDADEYFRAFMRAAERARHSIVIVGWDFNSRTPLAWDDDKDARPVILGEFLNRLARQRRALSIYILDWDFPMVFGVDREFPPLYGAGWKPHRRVHLRYDNTHPAIGSHHQKIVVIDGAMAFLGGLDLTCRRWDTRDHRADEPRRVADGQPYPPFHDVMVAVDGAAAGVLADVARGRWQRATGRALPPEKGAAKDAVDPWPPGLEPGLTAVDVAVSRTVPAGEDRVEVREIEALYLDMIRKARRYLYLENQYFTSHRIGAALAERLSQPDGPEIILVTRLASHGWLEEATMHVLRARLVKALHEADRHGRFRVYYPHVPGLSEGACVDVHSKVAIADDEWLRVGSANLSNRSMGMDTECDLTIEARGNPKVAHAVRGFLVRLLAEHLGREAAAVTQEMAARGSIAAAVEALRGEERSLRPLEELPEWSDAVISLAEVTDPERPIEMEKLIAEFTPDEDVREAGFAWGKAAIAAVLCLALLAAWRYTPLAGLVSPRRIIEWADAISGQAWVPLALVAAYTPASFTLFPRPLLTLFAVVAFGAWLGAAYAMAGILLAAAANYVVGQRLDRSTVRRLAGDRLNRVSEALRSRGLVAVTVVRLVPIAPFAVIGLVAGAIRVRLPHFLAGTAIGMLPGAVVTVFFGEQLQAGLRDPSRINYWLIGAVLLAFAAAMLAVRAWLSRVEPARDASGTASTLRAPSA